MPDGDFAYNSRRHQGYPSDPGIHSRHPAYLRLRRPQERHHHTRHRVIHHAQPRLQASCSSTMLPYQHIIIGRAEDLSIFASLSPSA